MGRDREARRAAIIGRIRALEEQHRAALEAGDKTQAQALFAQGQALYAGAVKEDKEAIEAFTTRLWAWATLYELNLKGSITRMQNQNQNKEAN